MNRDLLNLIPTKSTAHRSMQIIDLVQNFQPHEQMASMAAVFLLLSDHWNMKPQDVFQVVSNLMKCADDCGYRPEFEAIRQYMENEL